MDTQEKTRPLNREFWCSSNATSVDSPTAATCAHRQQPALAIAEVAVGSAASRGCQPDTAWLTQLRRGQYSVILATGLRRRDADCLAHRINEFLPTPTPDSRLPLPTVYSPLGPAVPCRTSHRPAGLGMLFQAPRRRCS